MTTQEKRLAGQALSMARQNTELRKIAAHVPARIWMKAKEDAGFGAEIREHLSVPDADEAWLRFVGTPDREWLSWERVEQHPETDIWLWWDCETTYPVTLMKDGQGVLFAPSGQWGWERAQYLSEMEGLWSALICPDPPAHLRHQFPPPETGD